jgi:mannose-6-phosphate isomerase-like protein (cupin superfamily)
MGGGSSGKTPGREGDMTDTTVIKVDAAHSPKGPDGQTYLASGKTVSMRMWRDEPPNEHKRPVRRDYETVGYVVSGRAELTVEGQTVRLEPGSSWVVPKGAEHSYRILEALTAIEATAPPAQVHARDEDRG